MFQGEIPIIEIKIEDDDKDELKNASNSDQSIDKSIEIPDEIVPNSSENQNDARIGAQNVKYPGTGIFCSTISYYISVVISRGGSGGAAPLVKIILDVGGGASPPPNNFALNVLLKVS